MTWLTSILIGVGKRLAPALVCAYFTEERGNIHRESDRGRWWRFAESAKASKTKADDAVAAYIKARFNFHDSPDTKRARAMAERAGIGARHSNHPGI